MEANLISATCPEYDVEYTGSDLVVDMFFVNVKKMKENVPSWSECSKWCGTLDGCKAWSYSTTQRTCTAKTNNNETRTTKGFVSGTRDCKEDGT